MSMRTLDGLSIGGMSWACSITVLALTTRRGEALLDPVAAVRPDVMRKRARTVMVVPAAVGRTDTRGETGDPAITTVATTGAAIIAIRVRAQPSLGDYLMEMMTDLPQARECGRRRSLTSETM